MAAPETTVPRCPRCRSTTFTGYVQDTHEASGQVVNGVATLFGDSAILNRVASFGSCSCGHEWRFRDKWALK